VTLAAGTRLGAYDVLALIGAGGMGEVYRARDPRLGREVAIKVLPAGFSADPERLQRFEQEARSAAALNHPNILAVYDIGTHDGAPYIVSELLEGETLRERLTSASLPVRKAIEYAVQIARGLAAAHEKGIVHRDLKPENIFVTADGRLKILDFGLAKLTQADPGLTGVSALPTTPPDTLPGVVLGTIGYMAPEQVRGRPADHRSDIFAFGSVLYEMLSGQLAFRGETTIDAMTAILKEDPPDLPAAERHIPPALARIVDRCLEKSPAARFQSTRDLAFALEGLSWHSESATAIPDSPLRRSTGRVGWWIAALSSVALLAALPFAIAHLRESAVEPGAIRFVVAPPDDATYTGGPAYAPAQAVSPDGRHMVFRAQRRGGPDLLWVRAFDALEARPLPGTEGGDFPFWSPDSRFIGFFADGKLKKIDSSGGPPQTLCNAPAAEGGTWNSRGIILFAGSPNAGLSRVPAGGGEPAAATMLDAPRKEVSHRLPHFLPDGRRFLFFAQPGNSIRVGSLDSPEMRTLLNADSKAVYAAPGYLLFVREQTLMAQPFDPSLAELTGDSFPVAEEVRGNTINGRAAFSVSESGVLAYRSGAALQNTQITWFDRSGKVLQTIDQPADYRGVALSPDEAQLIVHRHEEPSGGGLWLFDWKRGTIARFTSNPSHNTAPRWSPDGGHIVFGSNRDGGIANLYQNVSSGTGQDERLMKSDTNQVPADWSMDGRFIVYEDIDPKTRSDLWVLPQFGDRKPIPFLRTEFSEAQGQLSPDGRWMAYTSNETGTNQIYVQSFPPSGLRWTVSRESGVQPRWRRDGKELFYIAGNPIEMLVMAAEVRATGSRFESGTPRTLFKTQFNASSLGAAVGGPASVSETYMPSADGQRFVGLVPVGQVRAEPVTVVLNWTAGLTK
jgi:Tol biopolymer transport system component